MRGEDSDDGSLEDHPGTRERAGAGWRHRNLPPVVGAEQIHPDSVVAHLHPVGSVADESEEGVFDVHRRRPTVMGEEAHADLLDADIPGHRPAVVVVEDLVPGPALVDCVSQRPVLAHPPSVAPSPAIHDHRAVVRRRRLWVDGWGDTWDDQRLADGKTVGVRNAVGLDDRLDRHAVSTRYRRQRVPVLDGDHQGRERRGRRRRGRGHDGIRDGEDLADVDPVGIRQVVLLHDGGHRHAVSGSDDREALAILDGDHEGRGGRRRHTTVNRDHQLLAHVDQIGIGEAVRRHQGIDRDAVVEGDRRQAVAGLDQDDGLGRHRDRRTQPGGGEQDDYCGRRPAHPTTVGVRHSVSCFVPARARLLGPSARAESRKPGATDEVSAGRVRTTREPRS